MLRVEGIKMHMPAVIQLKKLANEVIPMAGLGHLTDLLIVDEHALTFTFVAETEAGEALANQIKRGRAQMRAVIPSDLMQAGRWVDQDRKGLKIQIEWDPLATDEERRIVSPFIDPVV
ncbi:MAG: hypothetical protein ACE5IM_12435 [Nitrospinota bacterium]